MSLLSENEKELLTRQIDDMNKQIEEEKTRASKLKKKVELHVLLNTEDEVRKWKVFFAAFCGM